MKKTFLNHAVPSLKEVDESEPGDFGKQTMAWNFSPARGVPNQSRGLSCVMLDTQELSKTASIPAVTNVKFWLQKQGHVLGCLVAAAAARKSAVL